MVPERLLALLTFLMFPYELSCCGRRDREDRKLCICVVADNKLMDFIAV